MKIRRSFLHLDVPRSVARIHMRAYSSRSLAAEAVLSSIFEIRRRQDEGVSTHTYSHNETRNIGAQWRSADFHFPSGSIWAPRYIAQIAPRSTNTPHWRRPAVGACQVGHMGRPRPLTAPPCALKWPNGQIRATSEAHRARPR